MQTITSNWKKKRNGKAMKQVVTITPVGKNRKGKAISTSKTVHIPA